MYIMEDDLKLNEWQFSQRKFLPYEIKIILTETRIKEWYENWNGNVYVSFSGGLDSTVMGHLICKVLDKMGVKEIDFVFSDTGLEFEELKIFTKRYVEWLNNQFKLHINLVVIRPKINFKQVVEKYGFPMVSKEVAAKIRKLRNNNLSDRYKNYLLNGDERGKFGMLPKKWQFLANKIITKYDVTEKCCDIMKKEPFKRYEREIALLEYTKNKDAKKHPTLNDLESWIPRPYIGITQDEGFQRQNQYAKTGCNIYDKDKPKSQPLGFWGKQDVLIYKNENNLPMCSVYGSCLSKADGTYYLTGEQRTGCVFCGFGCHLENEPNRFQRLLKIEPQKYKCTMNLLVNNGVRYEEALNSIGISTRTWEQNGQMNISDFMELN